MQSERDISLRVACGMWYMVCGVWHVWRVRVACGLQTVW
jgi:hypothetical protein